MILITKKKTLVENVSDKWQNYLFIYFSEVCPLLNIINRKFKQLVSVF